MSPPTLNGMPTIGIPEHAADDRDPAQERVHVHDRQRDAGQRHLLVDDADLPLHRDVEGAALQQHAVEDRPLPLEPRVDLDREIRHALADGFALGAGQALAHFVEIEHARDRMHAADAAIAGAHLRAAARGSEQRRRRSARREIRGEVHRSRRADRVFRETRDCRGDRQVARARAALDVERGSRRRQRERRVDPAHARGRDIGGELALVERHVRHERLQAIAEDVDMPGAQGDAPVHRPASARRAAGVRRCRRQSVQPPLRVDGVGRHGAVHQETVAGARDAAFELQWLIRESQRRVPHAHALAIRLERDPIDRERKIEHVGKPTPVPSSLPVARERSASVRSTVASKSPRSVPEAAGGDARIRAIERPDTRPWNERPARSGSPVERRARVAVLVLERQAANLHAAGPVAEIEFGAGPARKRRRARGFEPPWRGRGPAHAGSLEPDRRQEARAARHVRLVAGPLEAARTDRRARDRNVERRGRRRKSAQRPGERAAERPAARRRRRRTEDPGSARGSCRRRS